MPGLEKTILLQLLPRDEADDREVILEVRAGTGGDEASLFAANLFRMYSRFAQLQGWRFESIEVAATPTSGPSTPTLNTCISEHIAGLQNLQNCTER